MRIVTVILSIVLITTTALAQQKAAPKPKPQPDNGPSLETTMKFIQDKLNELGKVNYAVYWHNNANNTDGTNQFSAEASNVVANPASCQISYHFKSLIDGTTSPPFDRDVRFSLHDVQDLVVRTGEQNVKKINTDGGQPAVDARVDPPIFVLVVRRPGNTENAFFFRDEEMANRVAKAMVHAVELCGGGSKPEPF